VSQQRRGVARRIWSNAVFLADHFKSLEGYVSATIDELCNLLKTEQIKSAPAIVIPEASAGLLAIREKLGSGMFLLVDIGGGTTDIAMCSVYGGQNGANKTIGIHRVYSFNKGLNFIFEEYQKLLTNLGTDEYEKFLGINLDDYYYAAYTDFEYPQTND
jgi:hypothetical protein